MSQADLGQPDSATETLVHIANLKAWRDAVQTQHSGSSRPSYAVSGMVWLDTTDASDPFAYHATASDDVPVYQVDGSDGTIRTVFSADGAAYFKGGTTGTVSGFVSGTEMFRMDSTGISIGGGAAATELDLTGVATLAGNASGVVNGVILKNNNGSGTAVRVASAKGLVLAADYEDNSNADNSYIAMETDGVERVYLGASGQIYLRGLPTSDPAEADQLWRSGTDLKVSVG